MPSLTPRRILLVDDDMDNLESLGAFLEGSLDRVVVEPFDDAERALERVKTAKFDVVITDQRMPKMTGVEFLRRVAPLQPAFRILVTGEAITDEGPAKGRPDLLLRKPIDTAILLKSVRDAFARRG